MNPFTYLGRVMDASHAAFDTSRVATLSAYDADGTLLARIGTFFLPDSRRNYRLRVPLADAATKGYSKSGAVLSVSVEDGAGKTWTGDVVDLSPGAAQRDPQNTVSGQCCWTFSGLRRDAPPSAFFCNTSGGFRVYWLAMKSRPLPFSGRGALAAAALLFAFAPAPRACAQQAAVNPFTYLGRVMDASHAAFDTNRVATLSAYDADGELLARSETFFLPDSRRNYRLRVPLADAATKGYSQSGAMLSIAVEDDARKVWSGVVVDAGRAEGTVVGEPGGVREVDIVLGEDADGDGIDDALYARLKDEWEDSDAWAPDAAFDPNADYDRDGVPTIVEALAGTDPFNAKDSLRITAFERAAAPTRGSAAESFLMKFPTSSGRAYVVQTANAPTGTWSDVAFFLAPEDGSPVNVIARPSTPGADPATVYLLPSTNSAAFFRVKTAE